MYKHDELIAQIYGELESRRKHNTLAHSKNVCAKAIELCEKPRLSCALDDISVIIPKENGLKLAYQKVSR